MALMPGSPFDIDNLDGTHSQRVHVDNPAAEGVAQDGTDISSPTAMPAGGAGLRGWLSAIWTKLNATLDVAMRGGLQTLLAATTITGNTATVGAAVTGLDRYSLATILLTISGKSFDASTTLDVYLQYSPDGGVTWDDLAHFAQITSAALGNGTYVMFLNAASGAGAVDRVTDDAATLAVNSVRNISWCDRMRVKTANANISGGDTITITVQGYFQ